MTNTTKQATTTTCILHYDLHLHHDLSHRANDHQDLSDILPRNQGKDTTMDFFFSLLKGCDT
jgi:hypothetical protein